MSYVKQPKACGDAPIGFRTINQLSDNQLNTKAALSLEHSTPREMPPVAPASGNFIGGSVFNNVVLSISASTDGQHETPKVARGTMAVEALPTGAFGSTSVPTLSARFFSGVCTNVQRISMGQYFVPVNGLADFYAEVTPEADDNTVTRLAQQTATSSVSSTSTTPSPGVYVSLWEETLIAGNLGFALADFNFHVTVYGRRSSAWDATQDGYAPPASTQNAFTRRSRFPLRSRIIRGRSVNDLA